jgi:predicted metal-dependent peptidase
LDTFFAEIHAIWRTGVEVDVIECDAEVQALYTYKGTRPEVVAGGGGTAFDPVFEYMRTHKRSRYTGCIYLTDGYAPEPKVRPTCRIIWVVSPDGSSEYLKFGRVIQLEECCG